MALTLRQVDVAGGRTVSVVVAQPKGHHVHRPAIILAHGAGNDMRTPLLSAVHESLAAHGYAAVKFNFPYAEQRRRVPDPAPVLETCYRSVLDAVRHDKDITARPVVIGGKSLGGRIASHLAAAGAAVEGLIFLGYPLHPAGKEEQLRNAHLGKIRVPMLFFAGTRDPLCRLPLLQATLKRLAAPATLHIVDGGDHSFALPKAMQRPAAAVWEEIVAVCVDWLQRRIG